MLLSPSHSKKKPVDSTGDVSAPNTVCSIVVPDIIKILNVGELSNNLISEKLEAIEGSDYFTFFSGDPGNHIDNKGIHIWFVDNYRSLLNEREKGNQDAARIINKIQEFIIANLGVLANMLESTEEIDLIPVKENLETNYDNVEGLFLHGFQFDVGKHKGVRCVSPKGYPDMQSNTF